MGNIVVGTRNKLKVLRGNGVAICLSIDVSEPGANQTHDWLLREVIGYGFSER